MSKSPEDVEQIKIETSGLRSAAFGFAVDSLGTGIGLVALGAETYFRSPNELAVATVVLGFASMVAAELNGFEWINRRGSLRLMRGSW